jgi:SAM-dependent methyltransferase
MRILEAMVRKHIAVTGKPLRILNVGVATGATSQMLDAFGEVTSLEYDEETCDFLRSKVGIEAVQGSVTELPFENESFDLVTCFDVVEHVEDHAKAVSELGRVLKPAGTLFVTVPAFMFLWDEHDLANHHFRRYTRGQLKRLFAPLGLNRIFLSYFNYFLFPPIATFRLVTKPFKRKRNAAEARSDLRHQQIGSGLSKLLYSIFLFERHFLTRRIGFPFGLSLLYLMRKPKA